MLADIFVVCVKMKKVCFDFVAMVYKIAVLHCYLLPLCSKRKKEEKKTVNRPVNRYRLTG